MPAGYSVCHRTTTNISVAALRGGVAGNCIPLKHTVSYSSELRRLSVLLHEADAQLFRKIINNKEHCIHQLLPPEKILPMKRRASNCIFSLPQCHYNLYKRSFVVRTLFEDAY